MSPSRKDVGHVLVIASLDPRVTPKLHWAMIKDDIRSLCPEASKGPGRVNTDSRYSCTVDMYSKEDAEIVFSRIAVYGLPKFRGTRLLVHYIRTYPGNRNEIVTCNGAETACCDGEHVVKDSDPYFGRLNALFQGSYGYTSTTTTSGPVAVMPSYAVPTPATSSIAYAAGAVPTYATPPVSTTGASAYYMQQEVAVRTLYTVPASAYQQPIQPLQPSHQQHFIAQPTYQVSPSTGLPVNTAAGTVETESKGIHLSNLSYKLTESDLKRFVKQYAQPTKVSLKKDENGRSKGSAVVTFKTANEASIAAARLHGARLKGFAIKAKVDREAVNSREKDQGPLIANGSIST